jgi:hypothetical protein
MAFKLAATPNGEIAFKSSSLNRRFDHRAAKPYTILAAIVVVAFA